MEGVGSHSKFMGTIRIKRENNVNKLLGDTEVSGIGIRVNWDKQCCTLFERKDDENDPGNRETFVKC